MKFFKLSLIITIILFSVITSCNEESEIADEKIKSARIDDKQVILEMLGKSISLSLDQSTEFRQILKSYALKKYDYQYDVLYTTIRDIEISNGTVGDLVRSNFERNFPNVDFDNVISKLHFFQISIPVGAETWDYNNYSPNVVVCPDDEKVSELMSFNRHGNLIKSNAKVKPIVTTVAVGEAERIDKNGRLKVNKYGLVIKEENRISIQEVISKQSLKSQSVSDQNEEPLIQIVSDEKYIELQANQENEAKMIAKKNSVLQQHLAKVQFQLKSATTSRINLTGFSNQPKTIIMSWDNQTGMNCVYKVYVYETTYEYIEDEYGGYWAVNGGQNVLIGETSSLNFGYTTSLEGIYNFYVEAWANGQIQSVSNWLTLNSSNRHQGGREFISKISVSESLAKDIEGWWCQDLEFEIKVSGTTSFGGNYTQTAGDWIYVQYSGLNMKDTERTMNTTLFYWNRGAFSGVDVNGSSYNMNNGVYTVGWVEDDQPDTEKAFNIAKKAIAMVGTSFGIDPAITEMVVELGQIVFDVDYNDEILGSYDVSWWSPNYSQHNPKWGFIVWQSYN